MPLKSLPKKGKAQVLAREPTRPPGPGRSPPGGAQASPRWPAWPGQGAAVPECPLFLLVKLQGLRLLLPPQLLPQPLHLLSLGLQEPCLLVLELSGHRLFRGLQRGL